MSDRCKSRGGLYLLVFIIALNTCESNYRLAEIEKTWDARLIDRLVPDDAALKEGEPR